MRRLACLVVLASLLAPGPASAELGLGLSFGGYTGDRLYTASSNLVRMWRNPTGAVFGTGDELLVDLESWAQFGLNGWTSIDERWGLRFDLAFTEVDVDGKVLDPSGASETVQWDQWLLIDILAQATWRLGSSTDTYPYLALGPGLTVVSSEGDTLGQLMFGLVYGAGWRISAERGSFLDLSVRGQTQWPDFADEEARLDADEFEGEGTIFALSAAVTVGRVF